MGVPPKVHADMRQAGGRHYKGRGLGQLKAWTCPSCGAANTGPLTQGCVGCGAGKPGTVKKPGERIHKVDEKVGSAPATPVARSNSTGSRAAPPRTLADQVRRAAVSSVDYDEIERRVARALDERLGGGYSASERARLYEALEVMIALWEDGTIDPGGGLSLEQTRQLAQRVAPEDMEMTDGAGTTATPSEYIGDPEGDPAERGFTHGDPGDGDVPGEPREPGPAASGPAIVVHPGPAGAGAALRPAPELLDADHRGDEGGEDDAAGDGG